MRVCGKLTSTGEVVTLTIERNTITHIHNGTLFADIGDSSVWLSAGFNDIQLNGYGGVDFNLDAWGSASEVSHDLPLLFEKIATSGTALLCPTLTTNSAEAILQSLRNLSELLNAERTYANRVVGIHVEGPYISEEDGPRGAHPLEHVRNPDWEEFQRFQEAVEGRIRILTLAPERPNALPFIEKAVASGVVIALGHTGADVSVIRDAVHAGATLATHLGNGAHSLIRRHPNYIWEQLAHDSLYASLISDGHHLPASVLKSMTRAKGADRTVFVSDAVALGGLPAGVYMGGKYEVLPTGKIVLAGTPYLAGAGHLLDTCLANALAMTDLTLAQITASASAIPARVLGLEGSRGHIRVGYSADLTLFKVPTEDGTPLNVEATLCAGEVIYRA